MDRMEEEGRRTVRTAERVSGGGVHCAPYYQTSASTLDLVDPRRSASQSTSNSHIQRSTSTPTKDLAYPIQKRPPLSLSVSKRIRIRIRISMDIGVLLFRPFPRSGYGRNLAFGSFFGAWVFGYVWDCTMDRASRSSEIQESEKVVSVSHCTTAPRQKRKTA